MPDSDGEDPPPHPLLFTDVSIQASKGKAALIVREYDQPERYREYYLKTPSGGYIRIAATSSPDFLSDALIDEIQTKYNVFISLQKSKKAPVDLFPQDSRFPRNFFYLIDYTALSEYQVDKLEEILIDAEQTGDNIYLHCGLGCGRSGHAVIACMLIQEARCASLAELMDWDFDEVVVRVEQGDSSSFKVAGTRPGTTTIDEFEQKVFSKMTKPEGEVLTTSETDPLDGEENHLHDLSNEPFFDHPIERVCHMDLLVETEKRMVKKYKALKVRELAQNLATEDVVDSVKAIIGQDAYLELSGYKPDFPLDFVYPALLELMEAIVSMDYECIEKRLTGLISVSSICDQLIEDNEITELLHDLVRTEDPVAMLSELEGCCDALLEQAKASYSSKLK